MSRTGGYMSARSNLRHGIVGVTLAICLSACNSDSPSAPTPPPVGGVPTPSFTLSGTIVESSASGLRPVPSADVWISSTLRTTADREGKYSISGLSAGTYAVRFTSMFHEVVTKTVQVGGDTTFDVELVPLTTFTLSGTVSEMTAAGPVPVPGVHVENSNIHDAALTDEKGFFSVRVHRGSIHLYVAKPGYRDGTRTVSIDGDTRLDIQLVRQ